MTIALEILLCHTRVIITSLGKVKFENMEFDKWITRKHFPHRWFFDSLMIFIKIIMYSWQQALKTKPLGGFMMAELGCLGGNY